MSISVQQLVQTAFQNCSLIGDGESVDGTAYGTTAHDGALGLLNNLLSELNNQGYIASSVESRDVTFGGTYMIERPQDATIDRLLGVSRKIGDRWLPLHSCDKQQMDARTKKSLPTSWCYEKKPVYIDTSADYEVRGFITIDSVRPTQIRYFYNRKLEILPGASSIALSDMYFDLLLNGLCVKLCVKYKLTDYLSIFEQQFKQAKNLIKRSNATQRMIQRGDLGGGYDDSFYNGLGGVGW